MLVSRPPTARKINMGCCVKQESTQKAPWGKQSSFYFVHRPHAKVRSGFESLLGHSKIQPKGMQIFFFKPQGSLHKKAFEHPKGEQHVPSCSCLEPSLSRPLIPTKSHEPLKQWGSPKGLLWLLQTRTATSSQPLKLHPPLHVPPGPPSGPSHPTL